MGTRRAVAEDRELYLGDELGLNIDLASAVIPISSAPCSDRFSNRVRTQYHHRL
jgi:hypothetical protein